MAYSEDFIDYNRRYLELRDIFEFLFPISRDGENLTMGARSHNVFLFKKVIDIIDEYDNMEWFLVLNKHIFSDKKERSFIEHNSYKIENELWYNFIFILYKKSKLSDKKCNEENKKSGLTNKKYNEENKKRGFPYKKFRTYARQIDGKCFFESFGQIFEKTDIYAYLSIMDKFMPFSTLGFWLYLRMYDKPGNAPVIFHGQNPRLGGLQDILYQISFAIQKKREVYINNTGPFKFQKIVYEDISLMQKDNNLYIVATAYYNGNDNQVFKIYIQGDMDLKTGNSVTKVNSLDKAEAMETVKILSYKNTYNYNFYLISNENDITNDYLMDKIEHEGKWFDENAYGTGQKLKKDIKYNFKYYNYGSKWDVFSFKFNIKKRDKESFERWADSFGNFAIWEINGEQDSDEELYLYFSINTDTRIRNMEDERCINYCCTDMDFTECEHCKIKEMEAYENTFPTLLMEENSYSNLFKKNKFVSILELNWLLYAMKKYPNFSKVFLCMEKTGDNGKFDLDKAGKRIKTGISCIKRYTQCNMVKERAEDNPFEVLPDLTVPDLNYSHCKKFHAIIQGIKEKNITNVVNRKMEFWKEINIMQFFHMQLVLM